MNRAHSVKRRRRDCQARFYTSPSRVYGYDPDDYSFWGRVNRYAVGSRREKHEELDPAVAFVGDIVEFSFALLLPLFVAAGIVNFLADLLRRCGRRLETKAVEWEAVCRRRLRVRRRECVRGAPEPEALLAAWEESRGSLAGRLRLGALLSEIEPHVDQSLIRDENGRIVGRRPGIRGWLRHRCPELLPHYKAAMACKALADKVQMAIGLESKYSIVDVIDVMEEFGGIEGARKEPEEHPRGHSQGGRDGQSLAGTRRALREMVEGLPRRTMTALNETVKWRLGLVRLTPNITPTATSA